MSNRKYQVGAIGVLILTLILIIASIPQPEQTNREKGSCEFTVAAWDYPDEYGQGIYGFKVYENSTGSWQVTCGPWYLHVYDGSNQIFEWNATVAVKLQTLTIINRTITGATNDVDGLNYLRHNVTVTNREGSLIFTQQGFVVGIIEWIEGDEMVYYWHTVILNFLPTYGEYYTVTLRCDIFF